MTLNEIVAAYIREYRDAAQAEMDTFRREKSRASAIRRAAWCEFPDGTRHPHQCLIPKKLLELAEERLQAAGRRLAGARDFDALNELVEREIGSVHFRAFSWEQRDLVQASTPRALLSGNKKS